MEASAGNPPKPCKVCSGFGEAFEATRKSRKEASGSHKQQSNETNSSKSGDAGKETTLDAELAKQKRINASDDTWFSKVPSTYKNCPENAHTVGRAGWSVLHTMAAYYPNRPDTTTQKDMDEFVRLFARFYPCQICAHHLTAHLETNPVQSQSRHELSSWMCQMHNEVNGRLNKPLFDCSRVDERWLDGWKDGSCN
eukprot:m.169082 g.169082  ORF g.169082 m.169082 type:complete len:196 (+) comp18225_c0_seq2:336-923(+)